MPKDEAAAAALCAGLDASCRVPAGGGAPLRVVLATLDLNRGAVLPAEELVGDLGRGAARAYLSNVAVAPGARRRGYAAMVVAAAAARAHAVGVRHLYVHCVVDNAAALALYTAAGFQLESQETAAEAQGRGRPRRVLLHRAL